MIPMSKRPKKGTSFDEWVKSVSTPHGYPWEAWPKRARDEIAKAIAINDAAPSGSPITVMAMLGRLRDEYSIATSSPTLYRYCRVVLERSSWKDKE
jgi:hypothetical protein